MKELNKLKKDYERTQLKINNLTYQINSCRKDIDELDIQTKYKLKIIELLFENQDFNFNDLNNFNKELRRYLEDFRIIEQNKIVDNEYILQYQSELMIEINSGGKLLEEIKKLESDINNE